jgi:Na+/phosphate symporter
VSSRALLALSTPLLILLGLLGLLLRQGSDRLQAIPALAIGIGLLLQSLWCWRRRRRALLAALRDPSR